MFTIFSQRLPLFPSKESQYWLQGAHLFPMYSSSQYSAGVFLVPNRERVELAIWNTPRHHIKKSVVRRMQDILVHRMALGSNAKGLPNPCVRHSAVLTRALHDGNANETTCCNRPYEWSGQRVGWVSVRFAIWHPSLGKPVRVEDVVSARAKGRPEASLHEFGEFLRVVWK